MHGRAAGGWFGKKVVEIAEIFLEFLKLADVGVGGWRSDAEVELGLLVLLLGFEELAGSGDGVTLVVEEGFDAEGHFYVAAAIKALTGAAFVGLELGELALPETKNVGGDVAEFSYFTDAEVELIRNLRSGWGSGFADWLVLRHAGSSEVWPIVPLANSIGHTMGFSDKGNQAVGVETGWRGSVRPLAARAYWTGQVMGWRRVSAARRGQ